ncbi:hypothetical protein A2Z22_01395 [Candidatus Woesebacteria bacterium RBG_16_34_12]|uniref:Uncharacterized protein n=1 Tax=Candidatus Woesebacteria bacterium RBG_16_34_12 TaxID=1802480 RepID=A0A1F7XBS3_9BACT|nr:MAG: hypothetical protein A2Z22_01395 [Candidatus Woesebacteria bacterium RBG_16_34_12]
MEEDQYPQSHIFTIVVAGVLLVILLAVFIFSQKENILMGLKRTTSKQTVELTISESDKTSDIDKELESTDVGDFDTDIKSLENEVISL